MKSNRFVGLKIAAMIIGATALYTHIGQLVPQKEVHPPQVVEIDSSATPDELADIGRGIAEGKGLCLTCHTIGKSGSLRFPDLGPLRWKRELVGAQIIIESDDLLGERNVQFDLATVDKFVLEPKEGGSVAITFRVKVKPTPAQVAVLYQLQHTEVTLTVDPAEAEDHAAGEREDELEGMEP